MSRLKNSLRVAGAAIYGIGYLIGILFIAFVVWADLEGMSFWGTVEAATYDSSQDMAGRLEGLSCPLMITAQETGAATARVRNPTNEPIRLTVQADISDPSVADTRIRQDSQKVELAAGETREFSWTITPADRKYDMLSFVRVYLYPDPAYGPARTSHCGILVLDVNNVSSTRVITLIVTVSLALVLLGFMLWAGAVLFAWDWTSKLLKTLVWLTGVLVVGILAGLLGSFILAGSMLLLILISLISLFENLYRMQ